MSADFRDVSMTRLDGLLEAAYKAAPNERIDYRDALVNVGMEAVAPMSEWVEDARLGAFAIRVLERLAQEPASRDAALLALTQAIENAPSQTVRSDASDALGRLGTMIVTPMRRRAGRSLVITEAAGKPGVVGRGYWATHTWERTERGQAQRAYVWAELRRGHLRQGWGWDHTQDLRSIQERADQGVPLTATERMAWRARRMLGSRHDGIRVDDLVVAVGVPEPHEIAVVKVIGPYEFDFDPAIPDYGHLLPIRLLGGPVHRNDSRVGPALGHALKNRSRLWRIDGVGGDVEDILQLAAPTMARMAP